MAKGQQKTVLTPGQNQNAYIAEALNAVDGSRVWVGSWNKNSSLFIALLERLEQVYPNASTIYLFLENYSNHDSAQTRRWLVGQPRSPVYISTPVGPRAGNQPKGRAG